MSFFKNLTSQAYKFAYTLSLNLYICPKKQKNILSSSDKSLCPKVKKLGVGTSTSETPVLINLTIINDYFVDIDVSGAVRYTSESKVAPVNYPPYIFSFKIHKSFVLHLWLRLVYWEQSWELPAMQSETTRPHGFYLERQ